MSIFDRIRHAWRRSGYGTITESRAFEKMRPLLREADADVRVALHSKHAAPVHGHRNSNGDFGFSFYPPITFNAVSIGDRMFSFEADGTLKEIDRP